MTQRSTLSELHPFFRPRSVALIGASSREGKVGRLFMDRFLETGFQKLYPVNLRENEVLGVRAYPVSALRYGCSRYCCTAWEGWTFQAGSASFRRGWLPASSGSR